MTAAVNRKAALTTILLVLFTLAPRSIDPAAGQAEKNRILTVRFEGVITATTTEFLAESLAIAEREEMVVVILLDTPGGSLDAMFDIIDLIERSGVPIVGYVHPPGARAWSAGTFILMATHVAAMAPNTIIGSAQPVAFDPFGGGSTPIDDPKLVNALTKYMEERARAHGRNGDVAVRFVTENLNLNDEEAFNAEVIEFRAEGLEALLERIDGLQVSVVGRSVTLRTSGSPVEEWSPSLRVRFLGILSDPTLAYLLFVIGFFGLVFGLSSPGAGAEIVGGLLLILGFVGLGVFGINLAGLVLMFLGLALFVVELFDPGFGVFGGAGLVCLIVGSLFLFPSEWTVRPEWLNILYAVLIAVPLGVGGFLVFVLYKVVRARRKKPYPFGIVGKEGVAEGEITPEAGGFVRLGGELWKAKSVVGIRDGQRVSITGREGPTLLIESMKEEEITDQTTKKNEHYAPI